MVTLGHSAGGHLAAWAASRGRFERWAGGVDVTAVVSQAGVLDLRAAHLAGLGGGAVAAFLGHPPGPDGRPGRPAPAGCRSTYPCGACTAASDDTVPIAQSEEYVAAATAAGARAELLAVDGDHFVVIDPTSARLDEDAGDPRHPRLASSGQAAVRLRTRVPVPWPRDLPHGPAQRRDQRDERGQPAEDGDGCPPPRPASSAAARTGASGSTDIETNCIVDWIRPWSSAGVTAIR